MKAAVFQGPERMEVKEVDTPQYKEGEVLLKVEACAVCGTDARIYYHGQKNVVPPHIIGHEIGGTICETGKGVNGYKIGEKVTVVTSVGCGKCRFCRKGWFNLCKTPGYIGYYYPGGFAEYVIVPEGAVKGNNILPAPESLDFDEISLVEPLSCCINGQDYLNIQEGDCVVVFGAGPIGCMHAELAKAQGAGKLILIDISEERLALAQRFRVDEFINAGEVDAVKKVLELTGGEGADVIVTACSSNKAQEDALQIAGVKARISFFAGLPKDNPVIKLDSNIIHYKEISVYGAFASYRRQYEKALELISQGKIEAKKFITHRFSLDEIVKGIETARSGKALKVVIEP